MIELFVFCLLVSLFCTGLHIIMNFDEMLLVPVANFLSTHLAEWICKPLFECLPCMASVWSVVLWLVWKGSLSFTVLFVMFVVCGMNGIVSSIIKNLFDGEEK